MFYLTTHSTHFIYGYMASDIWLRTILIVRKETRCRHIGYSYRLTARVLLYAPSHRQDNTYHGLCYTSRGALAGTRRYILKQTRLKNLLFNKTRQYIHTYIHTYPFNGKKMFLFNNTLNTFYLRLCGMVKDNSNSVAATIHDILFPISSKGSFILCTSLQTG